MYPGDIMPPNGVRVAMEMQAEAERRKRAQILESEGNSSMAYLCKPMFCGLTVCLLQLNLFLIIWFTYLNRRTPSSYQHR